MERLAAPLLIAVSSYLCGGCANPGPPKPPSLRLPAVAKDLSSERVGDRVLLSWTTPAKTTDDRDVKGAMTAEVCREIASKPATPKERLTACAPVRRLGVVPGTSQVWDELPSSMTIGAPVLLTYRVQILNSVERSAGESAAAFAASGAAPASIVGLRASASESGAVIEWQKTGDGLVVDLKRVDVTPKAGAEGANDSAVAVPGCKKDSSRKTEASPEAPHRVQPASSRSKRRKGPNLQAKPEQNSANEIHLRATDGGGTVDATAAMCTTYTYVAERVHAVTIGNHALEIHSEPSATVRVAMRDTFPPKVPTGLAAIMGEAALGAAKAPYIDLSWEPNEEVDLAGYLVYRRLARPNGDPQGPLAKLTPLPIAAPAYRDVAVKAGQGYIYSVTAVDESGNESAPSAKAQETVSQ